MTYQSDDESVAGANPIELYTFLGPGRAYYYKTGSGDVTYQSNTFVAVPMARSNVQSVTDDDPPTLTVELPFNAQFVQDYAFGNPPSYATLRIRRYHAASGPSVGTTYFAGDVRSIKVSGRRATVEATVTAQRFDERVPNVLWQETCNHQLFGSRCGVAQGDYQVPTAVVVSTSDGGKQITVTTVDGIPALSGGSTPEDYLAFGTIERLADGERRLILSNSGLSNAELVLSRPFASLTLGDSMRIYAGCDRRLTTCNTKFSNVPNFGGHPYLLARPPFGRDFREEFD